MKGSNNPSKQNPKSGYEKPVQHDLKAGIPTEKVHQAAARDVTEAAHAFTKADKEVKHADIKGHSEKLTAQPHQTDTKFGAPKEKASHIPQGLTKNQAYDKAVEGKPASKHVESLQGQTEAHVDKGQAAKAGTHAESKTLPAAGVKTTMKGEAGYARKPAK